MVGVGGGGTSIPLLILGVGLTALGGKDRKAGLILRAGGGEGGGVSEEKLLPVLGVGESLSISRNNDKRTTNLSRSRMSCQSIRRLVR
jgi:hypothetical protein